MISNIIIRKIKSSLIVRYLVWPYMSIKKKKQYIKYHESGEDEKLKQLKDKYKGQRCFIIGNGASLSLNDLNKLNHEITIGSNRIYSIFEKTSWRPVFYMAEDEDGYEELIPNICKYNINNCIFSMAALRYESSSIRQNIYHALWTNKKYVANRYNDKSSHISEDISDHISDGYTVTFSAIQLAIYMGIKEIYLLGVDFNYSFVTDKFGKLHKIEGVKTYFDGKERKGSYLNYYSTLYAYKVALSYCKTHDIHIYNATRGGNLNVFERVNFDEIYFKD